MFFDDKTSEHVKCASKVPFMFILLDISVRRQWHKIKRGLISGTKILPSMSRRLNILFWCQSLRIIEQSAASQTLHFAQTFNCHTRRERDPPTRGRTHNNPSADRTLEGPEHNTSGRIVVCYPWNNPILPFLGWRELDLLLSVSPML